MALVGNFPGVYPTITDLSQVVTANSVTSCAYVGEAEFGPINTPTLITNKKGYVDRFGEIKSKYGYMGYSLAVAADSIGQHYVVRVVNEDTARYGQAYVPVATKSVTQPDKGLKISDVDSADKDAGYLFATEDETTHEIVYDKTTAIKIVSENPNNKDIRVQLEDSTINTNKTYKSLKTTIYNNQVKVTVPEEGLFEAGDKVIITCSQWKTLVKNELDEVIDELPYEKFFEVDSIEKTYYFTPKVVNNAAGTGYNVGDILTLTGATLWHKDGETPQDLKCQVVSVGENGAVQTVKVLTGSDYNNVAAEETAEGFATTTDGQGTGCKVYIASLAKQNVVVYNDTESHDPEDVTTLKILKYPAEEDTTFSVIVYEVKNKKAEKVEQYNYVTLFDAKDQYGNSTLISDVINGRSTYIKIYVNPYLEAEYNIPEFGTYTIANATSGNSPTMPELVKAWDLFKDRTKLTVTLLMNCGYINESENSYQQAMLEVAEKRRDCFCLFDVPSTATESGPVLDWRKNEMGFNTYRGAVFTPWVKTYDSVNGKRNFNMCPSAYIAKIMGAAGKPWIAAAGPNRGYYASSVVSPTGLTSYYDEDEGGVLYQNQLNCGIRDVAGYANWGQRTLQAKPSALDRINVARTVIYIETTLRDAARYHLFENNTPFERMQITLQFNQFLDEVLNGGGLNRYQVICDDSNNTPYVIQNNQLVIDIYLWPVYTTEFIALNTIVMGADAEITVSSNA